MGGVKRLRSADSLPVITVLAVGGAGPESLDKNDRNVLGAGFGAVLLRFLL